MAPRRLLVLATYPPRAAATRFRACAYFDALAEAGIEVDFRPFMTDEFMANLYAPGRVLAKGLGMASFAAKRFADLAEAGRWTAVFVHREAMPVGPAVTEWWLARVARLPMILDFDDAVWLEQPHSRNPLAAKLLRAPSKTATLLSNARAVVAGTEYLAAHAARTCRDVTVLPTVVSANDWQPLPGRLEGALVDPEVPTIGWVGTHGTAMHLDIVVPALRALAASGRRFKLRLVGASRDLAIEGIAVENVPWSEAREREDFRRIDIGIAPVVDDAWSRGKSGFKQVQYMTVGVPFVSSPVGGAREFVVDGENGFFARTTDDWIRRLGELLDDRALRGRFARAGRSLVESKLSLEAQAPRFVATVERVIASSPRRAA
jgi:glycosyltransferase involved in cell wall biosynthesis